MPVGLFKFERTYLERLKLACDVLELRGFKDQVEHELLQPDRPEPARA